MTRGTGKKERIYFADRITLAKQNRVSRLALKRVGSEAG